MINEHEARQSIILDSDNYAEISNELIELINCHISDNGKDGKMTMNTQTIIRLSDVLERMIENAIKATIDNNVAINNTVTNGGLTTRCDHCMIDTWHDYDQDGDRSCELCGTIDD
jgi:hypothetical protein